MHASCPVTLLFFRAIAILTIPCGSHLRLGAWGTAVAPDLARAILPHRRACWCSTPVPYATLFRSLRLRPGQRGARHKGATGLAWSQEHPAHGSVYRVGTGSF